MNTDYLKQLYSQPENVDAQLAAAGDLISKIAADEGLDLSVFSDAEIGEMVTQLAFGEGQPKVAHEQPTRQAPTGELTVADVAQELSKVAAAEGVDLSDLSREDYSAALNAMHAEMSDPSYFHSKVAMEEKVAEADMLGRVMAHSFADESEKIALRGSEVAHGLKEGLRKLKGQPAGLYGRSGARDAVARGVAAAKGGLSSASAAAKALPGQAASKERELSGRLGKALTGSERGKSLVRGIAGKMDGTAAERLGKARSAVGRTAAGAGLAATGAAGYGVSRAMDKESFDQEVVDTALLLLQEAGYEI